MKLKVTVNGTAYDVDVEVEEEPLPTIGAIMTGGGGFGPAPSSVKAPGSSSNALTANISGTVVKVLVEEGQAVEAGTTVLVLEAMKMETEVTAPKAGTVGKIAVAPGDAVANGQVLIEWAEDEK